MKKIAIIGGGISGLYIANLLRQDTSYEIVVYEKNNTVNLEKGYGVQLSVNSINLLNKIGFQSVNIEKSFNPNKVDFYSLKNHRKICDLDISIFNSDEAKYTTLERITLINFLKDKLPNNLINYNKKVTKVNHELEKIEITFEDNSLVECDYLIVSDGIFSSTKSLISKKEIKPKYFNSIAVRATMHKDNLKEINLNNISLFLGSNLHTVLYPLDKNGRFNFISILKKNLTSLELKENTLFSSKAFMSSVLFEISKQLDVNMIKNLKDIKIFPVFVSSEIYHPKNKNIFLIGDSFFAFPPTFAQGASQSIEVAHELYKNLGSHNNQFKIERIKRTKMIDRKSKLNFFAFHLSNPLIVWFRNLIIKNLVKNKKFIDNYLGSIYKN
jgi:salicylate hydroxylase